MSAMSLKVRAGGAPTGEQAVAIMAAVSALLDDEARAGGADATPAAYRSAWRAAAIREGLREPLGPGS